LKSLLVKIINEDNTIISPLIVLITATKAISLLISPLSKTLLNTKDKVSDINSESNILSLLKYSIAFQSLENSIHLFFNSLSKI
jgi:hypothetical protein